MRKIDRFLLWVDTVGGFWVCLDDEIVLGQPVAVGQVDVPILGDLSSHHALIRREGEGYLIEAIREVHVNERKVEGKAPLTDGALIQLGERVKLRFQRPHPLSTTARLDFVSRHRTQPSTDAIILMADTCILGPRPQCHIRCRKWDEEVVLFRQAAELFCRSEDLVEVDGKPCPKKGLLTKHSRVAGQNFALCLEEI